MSTSGAGRTPPPIAVWASRWPPNQKPRDGFCRAAVFGERVTDWQCQRKAKRAVAGYDFCEQHAREAEIKLGTREPVKRPPTKFEREMQQMEAKRARDAALLAERDRLASELAATLEAAAFYRSCVLSGEPIDCGCESCRKAAATLKVTP